MQLSIIIVSWNAKRYLRECLNSIKAFGNVGYEIIVVDNGSNDGSQGMVKDLFPEVKLICNAQNYGFAKANNIGIKESAGRYICLINSDVEVYENCLQRMIEYMDDNIGIGVLGPKTYNADGSLQRSCFEFPRPWNMFCRALALDTMFPKIKIFSGRLMTYWAHDEIKNVEILNGCFLMVRREVIEKVGALDETFFFYGEDMDWCKRIRDAGWHVVFYPKAEIIHYGGASSANSPVRFYVEMFRAELQYWTKHYGRCGNVIIIAIIWLHMLIRIIGMGAVFILRPGKRKDAICNIRRSIACIQLLLTGHDYQVSAVKG
jgi:GT2 family glycosyltransferase